jgi:hypothetical protein
MVEHFASGGSTMFVRVFGVLLSMTVQAKQNQIGERVIAPFATSHLVVRINVGWHAATAERTFTSRSAVNAQFPPLPITR